MKVWGLAVDLDTFSWMVAGEKSPVLWRILLGC